MLVRYGVVYQDGGGCKIYGCAYRCARVGRVGEVMGGLFGEGPGCWRGRGVNSTE